MKPIPKDMEARGFIPIFIFVGGRKGAAMVPKNEPIPPMIKPTEIAYKLNNNATITIKGANTTIKLKKSLGPLQQELP